MGPDRKVRVLTLLAIVTATKAIIKSVIIVRMAQ